MEIEAERSLMGGLWEPGPSQVRQRLCECGALMKIKVKLNQRQQLAHIDCLENTYLRQYIVGRNKPTEFTTEPTWDKPRSRYLYCRGCQKRRAWDTFKEIN